jgi:hypothetical protein
MHKRSPTNEARWLDDMPPRAFDASITAELWFAGSGSQHGLIKAFGDYEKKNEAAWRKSA